MSAATYYAFGLEIVLQTKLHLDEFFANSVENNPLFSDELKSKRDEIKVLVDDVNDKFKEYSTFTEAGRMRWTVEQMEEICAACHNARLKIFDYLDAIHNLMRLDLESLDYKLSTNKRFFQ